MKRNEEMTKEKAVELILAELERAEKLHPHWPVDIIHDAAIVAEESGELIQATLQYKYENGSHYKIEQEAIHTGAMAIRFLINL